MKTKLALACATIFVLASCQKEISADVLGTNTPNPLIGTWKFINLHGNTTASDEVMDQGSDVKTITIADYVTGNNQGTYAFTDTAYTVNGVGYDISTVAKEYTYDNGNLDDSTDFPFSYSIPPASSHGSYKRVGSDSLTFGSTLVPVTGASGSVATPPGGGKYSITGDTLKIFGVIHQAYTDSSSGVPVVVTEEATSVATLARQ